jgi:hypothetical protein
MTGQGAAQHALPAGGRRFTGLSPEPVEPEVNLKHG